MVFGKRDGCHMGQDLIEIGLGNRFGVEARHGVAAADFQYTVHLWICLFNGRIGLTLIKNGLHHKLEKLVGMPIKNYASIPKILQKTSKNARLHGISCVF